MHKKEIQQVPFCDHELRNPKGVDALWECFEFKASLSSLLLLQMHPKVCPSGKLGKDDKVVNIKS